MICTFQIESNKYLTESVDREQLNETTVGTIGGAIAGAMTAKKGIKNRLKGAAQGALVGSGVSNMMAGKGNAVSNTAKIGAGLGMAKGWKGAGAGAIAGAALGKGAQTVNKIAGQPIQQGLSNRISNSMQNANQGISDRQQFAQNQKTDKQAYNAMANYKQDPAYKAFLKWQREPEAKQFMQWKNASQNGTLFANDRKQESLREAMSDDKFQAFLTNLGKYNEGELVGDWFDFPMDEDEFEEALKSIGIGSKDEFGQPYDEWFVTDYNDPLGYAYETLGEYTNLDALNEYAEFANGTDSETFAAILEATGDFESAKDTYESGDYVFYKGVYDWDELAETVIDEVFGGVEHLDKDTLERYFDYEKLGRELDFDTYESGDQDEDGNYIEVSAGEYFCGDEDASDEEIGEAFVDEVGMDGVGNPEYYFDYDAYGRDLSFDNFTETEHGIIEIF